MKYKISTSTKFSARAAAMIAIYKKKDCFKVRIFTKTKVSKNDGE